jgi:hypothetical protein
MKVDYQALVLQQRKWSQKRVFTEADMFFASTVGTRFSTESSPYPRAKPSGLNRRRNWGPRSRASHILSFPGPARVDQDRYFSDCSRED